MKALRKYHKILLWLVGLALLAAIIMASLWPRTAAITPAAPNQPTQPSAVNPAQKTSEQKSAYTVPANHPRQLIIPKLAIDANILPVGLLKDGSIDAPKTAWDVGWYNASGLPGLVANGALVIDGHVNDAYNQPGIFYQLDSLVPGDQLQIQRGDGQLFTYSVVKVEQKPTAQVDMAAVMRPLTPGKEAVNLITCGGTYIKSQQTYSDRILVFTERAV